MSILILCDHENGQLSPVTLNAVSAASQIGGEMHLLVAGDQTGTVAKAAASIAGIAKVLVADDKSLENGLAENLAPLMQSLSGGYSHMMAAATTTGKNVMPRLAALLDVMQISDIIKVTDDIMYPYDNVVAIQLNSVKIESGVAKVEWSRGYNGATQLAAGTVYEVPAKIKIEGNYLLAAKIEMGYSPAVGWIKPDGKTSITIDDAPINMAEEMFLHPRVGDKVEIKGSC